MSAPNQTPEDPGAEADGADLQYMEEEDPGPFCRVCGCSNTAACVGGCIWAEPDLCSRCVEGRS